MRRFGSILTLALLVPLVACLAGWSHAATLIVAPNGEKTIQDQIDAADDGDLILVLSGIYKGKGNYNIDFRGKAIQLRSLDGAGACMIAAQGDTDDPRRVFIFHSGEGNDSIVDGFTITRGFTVDGAGAGILCTGGSSPTILNCIISGNMATGLLGVGGGIACLGSSPIILNNIIVSNSARGSFGGGGIYCDTSSAEITDNVIDGNVASYDGGGLYCILGSPVVTRNSFIENEATRGGGMCNWMSPAEIRNNLFVLNEGKDYGGGLYCRGTGEDRTPTIVSNTFTENVLLGGEEEEGPFGREIAFHSFNGDVLDCIIWRNDFESAIARYVPPPPLILVSGDDGTIGDDGMTLTAPSVADWTVFDIVPGAHVAVITNPVGIVTSGTYAISAVGTMSVTLEEQAGEEPDDWPGGPYGTCSWAISEEICDDPDPGDLVDDVYDVAVMGNSDVRLRFCLISVPPDFGGVYEEPGSSVQLVPYIYFDEPIPADRIFEAPSRLEDRNDVPTRCDPSDDVFVEGSDWHLLDCSDGIDNRLCDYSTSPSIAIDMGDRAAVYADEPCDNGARINLGAYGNTDEATITGTCPAPSAVIIRGPDDRSEGPLLAGGGTATISIWGENFTNFRAFNAGLRFYHAAGTEVAGFDISTTGGDANYGGLAVVVPEDGAFFPAIDDTMKLSSTTPGSRSAGFVLDSPVDIGPDIVAQAKTELIRITYDYTAAVPDGTYTIRLNTDVSFVSSDPTSHQTIVGHLTIGALTLGAIIIQGPDDRGEPALPGGVDGTVSIDIWGENLLNFGAVQMALRFLDGSGAPVGGFTVSTAGGDATYGGIAVVVPEDAAGPPDGNFFGVIDDGYKVSDTGLGLVGFVLDSDVTIGPDIVVQPRTVLFRITYDYTDAVPDGTYTVDLNHLVSVIGGGSGTAIAHDTTTGALTILTIAAVPCEGDANDDGTVDIRDMIWVRNHLNEDPASSPEAAAADVNGDGAINILDMLYVRAKLGPCP